MDWQPVPKRAEMIASRLLEAIFRRHYSINTRIPFERELAEQIEVTRPTLREVLQSPVQTRKPLVKWKHLK